MLQTTRPSKDRRDRVCRCCLTGLVLTIVTCHCAVRCFCFNDLAIWRHQLGCHQTKRAKALRNRIGLHVAVVVLTSPNKATRPLHRSRNHIVDQAVLVCDASCFKLISELFFKYLREQVLKAAVIGLEDCVLSGQVHRPAKLEAVVHRCACKIDDAVIKVVHAHRDARGGRVEHFFFDHCAVVAHEFHRQLTWARHQEISRFILVTKRVTANNNRLRPTGHKARNVLTNDWCTENNAAKDVTDRAVRATPHLLEAEFFNALLIRCDGRTFNANTIFLDRVCRVDRDLVVGLVTDFHGKIVILQINVQIGQDQFLLNEIPNDPCHFVAVEFDDWVSYLNLGHVSLRVRCEIYLCHSAV